MLHRGALPLLVRSRGSQQPLASGSLTLIFATGIAVVLVPVTLGLAILAQGLLRFHGAIYVVGGVVMLVLAYLALSGKNWMLPIMRGSPDVQRTDSGGVFVLGVFSGAASACRDRFSPAC